GGAEISEGNARALDAAAKLLSSLGHEVDDLRRTGGSKVKAQVERAAGSRIGERATIDDWALVPPLEVIDAGMAYTGVEISKYPGLPPLDEIDLSVIDPFNAACLERAKGLRASEYAVSWDALLITNRRLLRLWDSYDFLLSPVLA